MEPSPIENYLEKISNSENSIQRGLVYPKKINFTIFSRRHPRAFAEYVIESNPKKLTLKVEGTSKQDVKIGDFFDIKSLENYLLTGEMPTSNKQS
jgi:hypothetical protein